MKIDLTKSEISHILTVLSINEHEGTYCGNLDKFKELTNRIKRKLEG